MFQRNSIEEANFRIFSSVASASCLALFADYEVVVNPSTKPTTQPQYCGVIGFTGDICGTLLLSISNGIIASAMPNSLRGKHAQRDWIGELSNQLLGRIKNQLLRRDVEMHLSIPVVLLGEHISPLPRHNSRSLSFTSDMGDIKIWLDADFAPQLQIAEEPSNTTEVATEGCALMF